VFSIAGGRLVQAEAATLLNGAAGDVVSWYPMKEWHQGAFVEVDASRTVRIADVESASAGAGHVEVRYNVRYGNATLRVVVNGGTPVDTPLTQPVPANDPSYLPTEWRRVRVPVSFAAGTNQ